MCGFYSTGDGYQSGYQQVGDAFGHDDNRIVDEKLHGSGHVSNTDKETLLGEGEEKQGGCDA